MAKKPTTYKIGEACRELDIQPYVLRYWETEFPFLKPEKANAGQRTYSGRELQIIRRVKELLYDEGYTIAGAKKKLEAELEQGGPRLLELVPTKAGEESDGEGTADATDTTDEGDDGDTAPDGNHPGGKGKAMGKAKPHHSAAAPADPASTIQLSIGAEPGALLDSPSAERVQTLVRGLRELRDEAQEILDILRRNP
jgi:DNA-binding transcriptional MerR regulator